MLKSHVIVNAILNAIQNQLSWKMPSVEHPVKQPFVLDFTLHVKNVEKMITVTITLYLYYSSCICNDPDWLMPTLSMAAGTIRKVLV